jgi:uncharacterized protein YlxW (UPF0749 family)
MGHAHRKPVWGAVGVAVVLVLAGYLFAANARLAGGDHARQPQDLLGLVQAELDRADSTADEVADLRADVDSLTDAETALGDAPDPTSRTAVASGWVAVSGEGLEVRLTDAPATAALPEWATNDDLVVHQQDLEAVINALWAGGAEAMSLQDQRVVSTSAFRCVGNVLLLHNRTYSPPYVVKAIGDPDELEAALFDSPAIQTYLQYVDAVGLGWSVSRTDRIEVPAYDGPAVLKYAEVLEG